MFAAKGINPTTHLQRIAGDVREPLPPALRHAAPDVILMKHFLSAFGDYDVGVILRHCLEVLGSEGTVLLLQVRGGEGGEG